MEDDGEGLVVRLGTPDDLDELMGLALTATEENGFLNPSIYQLLQQLWPAVNRDHGLVGCIGKPGGIIEGAILLRIGKTWYSDDDVLEEKAIFIHPDFRQAKGGRAARLCEFSKQASDTLGIPLVIGVLSNQRTAGKIRMYKRQFGEPAGAYWLYNAKTGQHGDPAET
jgi:hypothetical protein